MGAYDDIINLPRPTSARHPRMPMIDRAAQFSPFAALVGHGAAIEETARQTDTRAELSEDAQERLNLQLQQIAETAGQNIPVTVLYFVPDQKKAGGAYRSCTGSVKRIDEFEQTVIMTDQTVIPIAQICAVEGELFHNPEPET